MKALAIAFAFLFTSINGAVQPDAQIFNTKLKITVIDELGNVVEGAEVTLYANQANYNAEKNPVQPTQKSNNKGQVTFKKLEPQSYYVIVRKGEKDNSGGGEIVSKLEKGKVNKANVVITDGI